MLRVRVAGSGWQGGPSLNTFYFNAPVENVVAAQQCVDRVRTAFTGKANCWPSSVVHNVDPAVDRIDPGTGDITDTFTAIPGAALEHATSSVNMAPIAAAGLVKLRTSVIVAGRRVLGRWFISPTTASAVNSSGDPSAEYVASLTEFGLDLFVAPGEDPELVVWHRPVAGVGGISCPVVSTSVGARFSVLRSRRD